MKRNHSFISVLVTVVFFICLLTGCTKDTAKNNPVCPFSPLTWESTYEDMTQLEGTAKESYDSVYGGTTYTYPGEYLGEAGTIKYMYDKENRLVCMAWAYTTDSFDALDDIYHKIHKQVVEAHGESGFDNANSTNYGDVWYLESGDILINAVTTESETALQYAYLNPLVSNKEKGK